MKYIKVLYDIELYIHLNGISMPLYAVKRYNIVLIWLTDCDSINVMMNIYQLDAKVIEVGGGETEGGWDRVEWG